MDSLGAVNADATEIVLHLPIYWELTNKNLISSVAATASLICISKLSLILVLVTLATER